MNTYLKRLLLASQNPKKARELKAIFADLALEVLTLSDFPPVPEAEENSPTYAENSESKARYYGGLFHLPTLADDSGLEIDFWEGRPGVHSARFLGKATPWPEKNQKILELLKDVPREKRTARFICVLSLVMPDGSLYRGEGKLEGEIFTEIRGGSGFGYDPIFLLPHKNLTMAELDFEEKNKISHRAQALGNLHDNLRNFQPQV